MATMTPKGHRDWIRGDVRGNFEEALAIADACKHASAYGFGKPNTWATISRAYNTDDLYTVRLYTNRQRDECVTYTRDPRREIKQILLDFGHPHGNPRWHWSM